MRLACVQLGTAGLSTIAAVAFMSSVASCGTDVNLGGTTDAAAPDAAGGVQEIADLCEPCERAESCPVGATCAVLEASHLFCATLCPRGSECDTDDVCKLVSSAAGGVVQACTPAAGVCARPAAPTADGALLDHCRDLGGPNVVAACKSCDKDDSNCQRNGCYGGWWCNSVTNKCQRPPANCP